MKKENFKESNLPLKLFHFIIDNEHVNSDWTIFKTSESLITAEKLIFLGNNSVNKIVYLLKIISKQSFSCHAIFDADLELLSSFYVKNFYSSSFPPKLWLLIV